MDHFAVQAGEDNPDLDQVEITFVEENGDVITAWYPRPGKGRLSGRWYDEELVNEAAGPLSIDKDDDVHHL